MVIGISKEIKKNLLHGVIIIGSFLSLVYLSSIFLSNFLRGKFEIVSELSLIIYYLFFIMIGFFIGIEIFIKEHKKEGKWKVEIGRILFLVLPLTYLTFYVYIYFNFPFLSLPKSISLILMDQHASQISGIILGYFLITSFRKKNDIKNRKLTDANGFYE